MLDQDVVGADVVDDHGGTVRRDEPGCRGLEVRVLAAAVPLVVPVLEAGRTGGDLGADVVDGLSCGDQSVQQIPL
jgi:hypothetical protein